MIGSSESMRRVATVGFAHDLFRSPVFGQWDAARQARWLRHFLAPSLEFVGCTVHGALDSVLDAAAAWAAEVVATKILPRGEEGWALLYGGDPPPGADVWFGPMLGYDLIVGYELSANQLRFLSRHGSRFIDISIDPIRFARRMLFSIRTNSPSIRELLEPFAICTEALCADIGFLRATLDTGDTALAEDLVFVGQVEVDTSLITGGRIQRIGPYLPQLFEMAKVHRRTVVYPHPLAARNEDVKAVLAGLPLSTLGEGQVYTALVNQSARTVVTLSSSVADEAELLGKQVIRLIDPDGSSGALGPTVVMPGMRFGSEIAQPCFWDALFHGGRKRPGSLAGGPDDATLRSALGVFRATSTMVRPILSLSIGEDILLTDRANDGFCRIGWSGVEESGRRMDGSVAALAFDIVAGSSGLVLSMTAVVGPASQSLDLSLTLEVIDGAVYSQVVSFSDELPREIELRGDIPPGHASLKFLIHIPHVPIELGISSDSPQPGVWLNKLHLLP